MPLSSAALPHGRRRLRVLEVAHRALELVAAACSVRSNSVHGTAKPVRDGRYGTGRPRFTVTLFFCVKLSSIPSRENSRPIPLCLTPP